MLEECLRQLMPGEGGGVDGRPDLLPRNRAVISFISRGTGEGAFFFFFFKVVMQFLTESQKEILKSLRDLNMHITSQSIFEQFIGVSSRILDALW